MMSARELLRRLPEGPDRTDLEAALSKGDLATIRHIIDRHARASRPVGVGPAPWGRGWGRAEQREWSQEQRLVRQGASETTDVSTAVGNEG